MFTVLDDIAILFCWLDIVNDLFSLIKHCDQYVEAN